MLQRPFVPGNFAMRLKSKASMAFLLRRDHGWRGS
jgi:hypothetical protein